MLRLVMLASLVALTGCQRAANDQRICTTPVPLADFSAESKKPAALRLDECVHRWSYRLAGSADPADTVAKAVLGACETPFNQTVIDWPDDDLLQIKDREQRIAAIRQAQTEGEAYLAKTYASKALFHVVQARAGRCTVPE